MSPPRRDPGAAVEAYLRRHARRERPDGDARKRPPPEWYGRRRRRVEGAPPDLEREERRVLAYCATVCRLERPEMVDVKRLAGGRAGYLVRGRRGTALFLTVERSGRVSSIGTERQWRETPEELR